MRAWFPLGLIILLPGCATIMEGTGQSVSVVTTPPGATCEVDRAGEKLGVVNPTPGSLRIDKSRKDLAVSCDEAGYQHATITSTPTFVATTFGNIVFGGVVGAVVDASTGADYKYTSEIKINLAPVVPAAAVATPTPLASAKPTS